MIRLLLLFLVAACDQPPESTDVPMDDPDLVERARGIHERVLTIDTHVDIPFNYATDEVDPGQRGDAQVDLVKMEEGGLDAAFFIVYVGQTERTPAGERMMPCFFNSLAARCCP